MHCFRISFNISVSQPLPNPSIAISLICPALTFLDLHSQISVWLRFSLSIHKIIVAASGYLKKLAHDRYRILVPVSIDYCILYLWPHILSTDCRKSRNNSTSILSRLFSYLYSCNVFAGLRPRCFGTVGSLNQLCIAYLLIPYSRLSSR